MTAYPTDSGGASDAPLLEALEERGVAALFRQLGAIQGMLQRMVPAPAQIDEFADLPWPHPGARTVLEVLNSAGHSLTRGEILDVVNARSFVSGTKIIDTRFPTDTRTLRKHTEWLGHRGLIDTADGRIAISGRGRRFLDSLRAAAASETSQEHPNSVPRLRAGRGGDLSL